MDIAVSTPQRHRRRRGGGWRAPEEAIYVGNGSRWANPFAYRSHSGLARVPALDGSPWEYEDRVSANGMQHNFEHPDGRWTRHTVRWMTREECVEVYRRTLVEPTAYLRLCDPTTRRTLTVTDAVAELRGHDLICWCEPTQACHADVLIALANEPIVHL